MEPKPDPPSGHALHYAKDKLEQELWLTTLCLKPAMYFFISSYIELLFKYGAFLFWVELLSTSAQYWEFNVYVALRDRIEGFSL